MINQNHTANTYHPHRKDAHPVRSEHANKTAEMGGKVNKHGDFSGPTKGGFDPAILSQLLQLIQQLLAALKNQEQPCQPEQPEAKTLDLPQEKLDQLTAAANFGLAFGGGNAPKVVSVSDDNHDGVLSPGDTVHTEAFSGSSESPVNKNSFELTQGLFDISERLQSGVPDLNQSFSSQEFQALSGLVDGQWRGTFDNDGSGNLSVGDEIVIGNSLQVVDDGLLSDFNDALQASG